MADKFFDYPLRPDQDPTPRTPLREWWKMRTHTRRWRRLPTEDLSYHVDGIEAVSDITSDEIVVITRERNGYRFVRSFLRHYRDLGANRFVIIDESSTDGTPELLQEQPDVVLLRAKTAFKDSLRGRRWVDAVLMHLSKGQRVIVVDNDEYLVFSDGTKNLAQMFDAMAAHKLERLCTMMLDLYPHAPVRNAVFDGKTDQLPWEVAPLFDTTGYELRATWQGPRVTGGVRKRLFDETLYLTKFAAMFNPKLAIFDRTAHFPQPLTANKGPVAGVLLHFKFFSDFMQEHQRVVERAVHNRGGKAYQAVLDRLEGVDVDTDFDFVGPATATYHDPRQLCELGLMVDICESLRAR